MTEKFENLSENPEESIEAKKERLKPIIEYALKQYYETERALEEFTVEATRKIEGKIETIPGLIVLEIDEDGINLAGIENGELTASATMLWFEIIDLKMDDFEKQES